MKINPKILFKYSTAKNTEKILFTGIQPTGNLHIGNYFGSVFNVLKFQQEKQFSQRYLMLADLHSLTVAVNRQHSQLTYNDQVGKDTLQMAKVLLASGVNPQKITLFAQSHIPQHSQLTWILSCLCTQHYLNNMIQYKQKSHQNSSVGLYTYPILMASDIMLYRSTHVPVGVDQVQHLQLSNKITDRFNKLFKIQYFPEINYVESPQPKVMSLTDPDKKMSKSDVNQRSRINLCDDAKQIKQKIRRATTDSQGDSITYEPQKRKGLANLLTIYSALRNIKPQQAALQFQQKKMGIGQFKNELINRLTQVIQKIQKTKATITDQQAMQILRNGGEKARKQARKNINQIKSIMHLL